MQIFRRRYITVFFLLSIILLSSCKKEEDNEFSGYLHIKLTSKYIEDDKANEQLESLILDYFELNIAESSDFNIEPTFTYLKSEGKTKIWELMIPGNNMFLKMYILLILILIRHIMLIGPKILIYLQRLIRVFSQSRFLV